MRRLGLFSLGIAASVSAACSLRSLDELKRCTGQPSSADCPSAAGSGVGAQAGAATAGGSQGGAPDVAGAGSTPEAGGASGEAGGAAATESALRLLYADHSSADDEPPAASKQIRPIFSIENHGTEPVDVSELSIRYYYTLEAPMAQTFDCEFVHPSDVVNDCLGIIGSFGTLSGIDEATDYVEVTFEPPDGAVWIIPARGGKSGIIQLHFWNGKDFELQDQTNDYSFDESKLEPAPWAHVTLYRGGVLISGREPQ